MTHLPDEDLGFSASIKSGNKRCFKCNGPIYFTSNEAETPSGRPTKDPLTGKVIALDPLTNDHHICKQEDVRTKDRCCYSIRRNKKEVLCK